MKIKQIYASMVLSTLLAVALIGCSDTLSRSFYRHHPRSLETVEQVWGAPVSIVSLEDGIERRTYAVQTPYTDLKYRYFLIQDGMVLASGITDAGPSTPPSAYRVPPDFAVSDLSKAFYERHPTTVAHLDTTWGAPICTRDAKDGFEYRVYAVDVPYADFRYRQFMVKDGRVVASHLSPEQTCPVEAPRAVNDITVNEISHRYYAGHPMSLHDVETVWGEPVLVRQGENGLEKRIYRLRMPTDVAFAFRFFIIQNGRVVSSGITDTVGTTGK
jgi:hypothetical protein